MTRLSFAQDLEAAANQTDDRAAAAMLRRAVIRLNAIGEPAFDEDVEEAIALAAVGLGIGRKEMIRLVMRDWLIGHGYLEGEDNPDVT